MIEVPEDKELPPGWAVATIAETGEYLNGFAFKPTDWHDDGISIIRIQNLTDPRRIPNRTTRQVPKDYVVKAGNLLVSWSASLDVFVWRREDAYLNQHIFKVTPRTDIVDQNFLFHLLKRSIEELLKSEHLHGSTMKHINRKPFLTHRIGIPPLHEQTLIAAKIDELFGEIEAGEQELEQAREGLATYRLSLLKAAVNGELTRDWRAANKPQETGAELIARTRAERALSTTKATRARRPPASFDAGSLREIPETWSWCTVGEAGDVSLGRQRAPQHHNGPNMRPYLRVANVLDDRLDLSDVAETNFTPKEFEHYSLRSGDILLNEGQSPELVGRSAVYREEIDGCCFQKTLLRFRPSGIATTDFAQIVFQFYLHSQKFLRLSPITTNMAHLTQVRFVAMEFPVPPIDEQLAIAESFQTSLSAIRDIELLIAREDRGILRQSILRAAFEGRLVPQADADEPASELLDKLRAKEPVARPKRRARANAA